MDKHIIVPGASIEFRMDDFALGRIVGYNFIKQIQNEYETLRSVGFLHEQAIDYLLK